MRAGAGLRVILYGESFFAFDTDTFDRLVIKVDVSYFHMIIVLYILRTYFKAVILRGDLRPPGDKVFDRMVETAMTVVHLICPHPRCQCQQLMAEAYTEERFIGSDYIFDSFDSIVHRFRIAGAIGDEVAIR